MRLGSGKYAVILFFLTSLCYGQLDSFMNQGVMRTFILHKPTGTSSPALVINMHGYGLTASQQQSFSRFDDIADREKFIVVYPNGIGTEQSWDIGGDRDVNFISALIDTMNARYTIDLNRVHATGFSMGSMMCYRLACALASRIASIGSVAGRSNANNSSRPVPVLHIHGTADTYVDYSSVAATISGWVNRNGCPSTPVTTDPYPPSNPNSVVKKDYYGLGLDSSEVILFTVEGGGHYWPGTGSDINASEEIWAFFKKHPLPGTTGIIDKKNPLHGAIQALWGRSTIDIITIDGRVVAKNISAANRNSLLTSLNIAAGVYFIRFRTPEGIVLQRAALWK